MADISVADQDYSDTVITAVRASFSPDGVLTGWETTHLGGWSFYVPADDGVEPQAGQVARFYPGGFGRVVRGLVIGGQTVFYRTEDEQRQLDRELVERWNRERREKFAAAIAAAEGGQS